MVTIKVFEFGMKPIRVVGTWENPLFVLADVCAALGLGSPSKTAKTLDQDELAMNSIQGQSGKKGSRPQEMHLVTEAGLYQLIFQSRKPQAKVFKKWVTAEVLPSIRKTGMYQKPKLIPICDPALANQVEAAKHRLKQKIDSLEVHTLSKDMSAFMSVYRGISELLWDKPVGSVMNDLGLNDPRYEVSADWWRYLDSDNQQALCTVINQAVSWLDTLDGSYGEIKDRGERWMRRTKFKAPNLGKGKTEVKGTPNLLDFAA